MHHQRTASHLSLLIADCLNRGHLLACCLPYFLTRTPTFLTTPPLQTSANSPYGFPTTTYPLPLGLYLQLSSLHAAIALLETYTVQNKRIHFGSHLCKAYPATAIAQSIVCLLILPTIRPHHQLNLLVFLRIASLPTCITVAGSFFARTQHSPFF